MEEQIIQVENVSMEFHMSSEKIDNIKEFFIKKIKGHISYDTLWALKNISFQIKRGESVALVGLNGSGKSTLLKILAGVLKPTKGRTKVYGSVAPLIELGAGFDMDLTARENVWLNGAILGYNRSTMREHYDAIVEFAELQEFMDTPLKNFSSGMLARLAFSVMTFGTPDLLIVDEVLSVGDFTFQKKCKRRIREMQKKGTTIFLVSHNMEQVQEVCDRAIWLEKGIMKMDGSAKIVTEAYLKSGEEDISFDIVVPLYRTPRVYLEDMIRSIQVQTYDKWQLYLSDGSGEDSPLDEVLMQYAEEDERIHIIQNHCQLHRSENTNKALKKVTGDYVVFVDHDDMLEPNALHECVKVIRQDSGVQFIYTDSDKISEDGAEYSQPCRKPDFNMELLRAYNYVCHLSVIHKTLVEKVGFMSPKYNGAQDYDYILRCAEETDHIVHIPKILYHWRMSPGSVATSVENKPYAYDAAKKLLQAHYKRSGMDVDIEYTKYGSFHPIYQKIGNPLVSVLIFNHGSEKEFQECAEFLKKESAYQNMEILPYGSKNVKGEYLLFLDSRIRMEDSDSIREMLGYCMRQDVGVVGARILACDETIWHAGIDVHSDGAPEYVFRGVPKNKTEYYPHTMYAREYAAVSASCMMIRRSVYENEEREVLPDEVAFCQDIHRKGYRIIYLPHAVFSIRD